MLLPDLIEILKEIYFSIKKCKIPPLYFRKQLFLPNDKLIINYYTTTTDIITYTIYAILYNKTMGFFPENIRFAVKDNDYNYVYMCLKTFHDITRRYIIQTYILDDAEMGKKKTLFDIIKSIKHSRI